MNPPFEVGNSFELQILLEITIHICAQSYTWKELQEIWASLLAYVESRNASFRTLYLGYCLFFPGQRVFLCWIEWLGYFVEDSCFSLSHRYYLEEKKWNTSKSRKSRKERNTGSHLTRLSDEYLSCLIQARIKQERLWSKYNTWFIKGYKTDLALSFQKYFK